MAQCQAINQNNKERCKNKVGIGMKKYCTRHSRSPKKSPTSKKRAKASFKAFKRAWAEHIGKPKTKFQMRFINGVPKDYRYIWAYYEDFMKTPSTYSLKDYFYEFKRDFGHRRIY